MILVNFFIACHGQTIHLSITTDIGCVGREMNGLRCTLFDYPGSPNPVDECLIKDCIQNSNAFFQSHIRSCMYGQDPTCVPIVFEFEIPKSKQKDLGKCPESKIVLQLEERVIKFESASVRIVPRQVEIYSSGKENSLSKISVESYDRCPIAPVRNGLTRGASPLCFLDTDWLYGNAFPLNQESVKVGSVKLKFIDEKTKNVIPMPAKQCASSTTPPPKSPPQKSNDKLIELLLIQLMLQNNGVVSRGAYPNVYNSIPGYAPLFPYTIGGYPSAFSGTPLSGLPSTNVIRRKP